jgi:hypothetical protein
MKSKRKKYMENLGARIILRQILRKKGGADWIQLAQDRDQ